MIWESVLSIHYLFEDVNFRILSPRCFTLQHLINDDPKAPVICKIPTYRVWKHFRTWISWCTNKCCRLKMWKNLIFIIIWIVTIIKPFFKYDIEWVCSLIFAFWNASVNDTLIMIISLRLPNNRLPFNHFFKMLVFFFFYVFGLTKITELNVLLSINKNVIWL